MMMMMYGNLKVWMVFGSGVGKGDFGLDQGVELVQYVRRWMVELFVIEWGYMSVEIGSVDVVCYMFEWVE